MGVTNSSQTLLNGGLAMRKVIMIGCDLHAETIVLKLAIGRGKPGDAKFANTVSGRATLLAWLRQRSVESGRARIVFAYEAASQGFGLYDQITGAGFECHVLAPTKIARSPKQQRDKGDEKDAEQLLELVRGHVLAGNSLPDVWVPSVETRDDRELVRSRLDAADKFSALRVQVKSLLARNQLRRPEGTGKGWTRLFAAWLRDLSLGPGARATLDSLLRQLEFYDRELKQLDQQLIELAAQPRYAVALREVCQLHGVGVLTGLVFLTEVGDPRRFGNRRQIAAYLGLVPTRHESGSRSDCKGHITRQGPSRVRRVLCQATWARVRYENDDRAAYQRIAQKNPKHKKIAVVAAMRRLAIQIWHAAGRGLDHEVSPRGRNQRPQVPPPGPHLLPSLRSS
jgi:transposase